MPPLFLFSGSSWRVSAVGGRARAALLAGLVLAGVAGCATGNISMLATIAGGEKVRVPFGRGGPEMTSEGGVQINVASYTLNAEKKALYLFEFTDSRSRALRRVHVEDVSDSAPLTLVDDTAPTLAANGRWHGETPTLEWGDPRIGWLATISNSLRVFRFTLTFADGQTLVLLQGAFYPAGLKTATRAALGQNY